MAASDAPKREQKDPIYHVAELDPEHPETLKIIARDVQAKNQIAAMDQVADGKDEPRFLLGAFLASSLKAKRYENRTVKVKEGEVVADPLTAPARHEAVEAPSPSVSG